MSSLASLQNVSIAFGGPKVLDNINLRIEKGQRICLLGRNGTGKSTLMKIIEGRVAPDSGLVQREQNIKISYFAQDIPDEIEGTVFEIIAKGLGPRGKLLLQYYKEEQRLVRNPQADHTLLDNLHHELDVHNAWSVLEEINSITTRMSLDYRWDYNALSGGRKRRVLLAAALVSRPDLLLLDEPTNHLDINAIAWLEEYLLRLNTTMLFVTHDRMLLKKLATRIIELDRGDLIDFACDYDTFLKRKQGLLDAQEKEWANFDKKLAREEVWIRRGIKARRTRNEGRVRALLKMRQERKNRRQQQGTAAMALTAAGPSGNLVIEAKGLTFSYDDQPLIKGFDAFITRGDKIGIVGPNGCGKTTLIKILLGQLTPQTGTVRNGTNLAITYYDQMRQQLDEGKTVWENVLPNGHMVTVNGKNKHILGYLQDFLFTPQRAKMTVRHLSGGERNRLLLARLFTRPANLLVFDEPTNDLDAETLELLEELLVNFKGTLLLICHDRAFLNNVVTSTLVFEGGGAVREYIGGYDDYLVQTQKQPHSDDQTEKVDKKKLYREQRKAKQKKKLNFYEALELKEIPTQIESLEAKLEELHQKMTQPDFYLDKEKITAAKQRCAELEATITHAYQRWEHLESIQ